MSKILCIDDEPATGASLEDALTRLGHRALIAMNVREGLEVVVRENPDLIISEFRMSEGTGLDLLRQLREQGHEIPVIIMAGFATIENAVLSIRDGAVDYLSKPLRAEALRMAVTSALEVARLRRENEDYRREISALRVSRKIVGESQSLRFVMETIAAVAPTRATVLLEGESGTGKELFARALHDQSPRREHPFVTVNCAALPEGLVESALFGHERGAFTGALARSQGAFERAHRGTLLLDEISEMRLDLQAKLLRVIQEQEIERVGGNQTIKVDVRIVATTNRSLIAEVDTGRFRRDLYYRLNVVPIHTPSLRERLDDIPMLVEHFETFFAAQLGVRRPQVTPEAIEYMRRREWPGNIRELANVVERAVILNRSGMLTAESFGPPPGNPATGLPATNGAHETNGAKGDHGANGASAASLPLNLKELEKISIGRALVATGGHRIKAAELLGISERTLRNKLNGPAEAEV